MINLKEVYDAKIHVCGLNTNTLCKNIKSSIEDCNVVHNNDNTISINLNNHDINDILNVIDNTFLSWIGYKLDFPADMVYHLFILKNDNLLLRFA